jgi:hypothetical protein
MTPTPSELNPELSSRFGRWLGLHGYVPLTRRQCVVSMSSFCEFLDNIPAIEATHLDIRDDIAFVAERGSSGLPCFANAVGLLAPPIGQQRRVQSFAAQQRTKATSRHHRDFGFLQNTLFVLRSEGTALRSGNHFGIKRRDRPGAGAVLGAAALRYGSLRSPSLRSAPAKAPGERTAPREFPLISASFFLALLTN